MDVLVVGHHRPAQGGKPPAVGEPLGAPSSFVMLMSGLSGYVSEYRCGSEGAGLCAISSQEWLEHPGEIARRLLLDEVLTP